MDLRHDADFSDERILDDDFSLLGFRVRILECGDDVDARSWGHFSSNARLGIDHDGYLAVSLRQLWRVLKHTGLQHCAFAVCGRRDLSLDVLNVVYCIVRDPTFGNLLSDHVFCRDLFELSHLLRQLENRCHGAHLG